MIMNIGLADEINDEFATYFRSKGFKVIWDFNRLEKVYWYEIYLDDDLCCQGRAAWWCAGKRLS